MEQSLRNRNLLNMFYIYVEQYFNIYGKSCSRILKDGVDTSAN
jgi:hypothetical protein